MVLLSCMLGAFGFMGVLAQEGISAFSFAVFQRGRTEKGDLKERLETGLRPRTPREFAYVQRVVDLTQQNKLPLGIVQVTFNWARRKRPYPFPYFERALAIEAGKRGIQIR